MPERKIGQYLDIGTSSKSEILFLLNQTVQSIKIVNEHVIKQLSYQVPKNNKNAEWNDFTLRNQVWK